MSNHDAHTMAYATPVGHRGSGSPTTQLAPSISAIFQVVTLEGWQNALQESRPANI